MQSLLAPILAQLLTVGAGARTEVRDVVEFEARQRIEGSAEAGVGIGFSTPNLQLGVGYSPGVTVSPLFPPPREVTYSDRLFAGAAIGHTFAWRRTSLTLRQSGSYTMENPVLQAIAGPPPVQPAIPALNAPPGTGGMGGAGGMGGTGGAGGSTPDASDAANARRAEDYRVQTWELYSAINFEQLLSRVTTFRANAGYSFTAGFGTSRADNPLVQGPDAGVELRQLVTRRDQLLTELDGHYRFSEDHEHGQSILLTEIWGHDFSRRTHSDVGAGVAYTRSWTGERATLNGIYPTGYAAIRYNTRLARGTLVLGAGAGVAPVLDYTTAIVDPRLGVGAFASWTRRRFSLRATLSSAVSLADDPDGPGTLNTLNGDVTATYDLGAGFYTDGGVRAAWERFEGVTVVNPTSVIFVGLGWRGEVAIIEPR